MPPIREGYTPSHHPCSHIIQRACIWSCPFQPLADWIRIALTKLLFTFISTSCLRRTSLSNKQLFHPSKAAELQEEVGEKFFAQTILERQGEIWTGKQQVFHLKIWLHFPHGSYLHTIGISGSCSIKQRPHDHANFH